MAPPPSRPILTSPQAAAQSAWSTVLRDVVDAHQQPEPQHAWPTVFRDVVDAHQQAEPRATPGGQSNSSNAVLTAQSPLNDSSTIDTNTQERDHSRSTTPERFYLQPSRRIWGDLPPRIPGAAIDPNIHLATGLRNHAHARHAQHDALRNIWQGGLPGLRVDEEALFARTNPGHHTSTLATAVQASTYSTAELPELDSRNHTPSSSWLTSLLSTSSDSFSDNSISAQRQNHTPGSNDSHAVGPRPVASPNQVAAPSQLARPSQFAGSSQLAESSQFSDTSHLAIPSTHAAPSQHGQQNSGQSMTHEQREAAKNQRFFQSQGINPETMRQQHQNWVGNLSSSAQDQNMREYLHELARQNGAGRGARGGGQGNGKGGGGGRGNGRAGPSMRGG